MDVADWLNRVCSREILFPLISVGHWMYYNRCKYLNWVPHGSLQSPWSVSNLAFLIIAYRNVAWCIVPRIVCAWFCRPLEWLQGTVVGCPTDPPPTHTHTSSFLQYSCPMLSEGRELFQFKPSWNQTTLLFVFAPEHHHHCHVHEGLGVIPVPWFSNWNWSFHLFLGRPMFLRLLVYIVTLVLVFCLCLSSVRVVATFPGTVLFPLLYSVLPFFPLIHRFFSLSSFVSKPMTYRTLSETS
jgi:hypothetical protein